MKFKDVMLNFILLFALMSMMMVFFTVCNVFEESECRKTKAKNEEICSEYRKRAEQLRLENNELRQKIEKAKLKAFLKAYGDGTYFYEDAK